MGYPAAPRFHPLRGLTPTEIKKAAHVVTQGVRNRSNNLNQSLRFKNITLEEPPKAVLLPYLDAECAGVSVLKRPFVPRCAQVTYTEPGHTQPCVSVVSLDAEVEVNNFRAKKGQHSPLDRSVVPMLSDTTFTNILLDRDEVIEVNRIVLSSLDVRKEILKLGLPADVVIQCDTWPYGADSLSTLDTPRLIQAMLYARAPHNHPDSNQYSFPIPISPVIDVSMGSIIRIDHLATGGKEDGLRYGTAPNAALAHCVENEYLPDLQNERLRGDIKPLLILQPEGPSFKVEDETAISWQKWRFRVGFNWREGLTIHDVRYDNRKLFYRLSLSEMTVPYGGERQNLSADWL